ncbi:PAS domain-containing protein [Candidatus Peregrinibacteria bacterium]|nr:PAS domain-containing protein [Candidatus Peregrinibacteria bacterium]
MVEKIISILEQTKKNLTRSRFFTIRNKLAFYFVVSALFSSLLLGFLTIRQVSQTLSTGTETLFSSIASHKVSQLRLWLEDNKNRVAAFAASSTELIAETDSFRRAPEAEIKNRLVSTMEQFLYHNPVFFELFLVDPATGKVIVSTTPAMEEADMSDQDCFREGIKALCATPIYSTSFSEGSAITIAIPLSNASHELLAVLGARVNLFSLNDILAERGGLGKSGETYIVSRGYSVVAGTGFTEEYQVPAAELEHMVIRTQGALKALDGQKGFAAYMGYGDYEVMGYYEYLPFFDAALLVEQYSHETLEPIHTLEITIGFYIFAVLVLFIIMANVVAATFSRPIVRLAESAHRIASGQLKHNISVNTADEIGTLAIAFRQMTNHLVNSLNETKNVIETMPDALFILDREGKIQSANHTASLLVKARKHHLVGQSFGEFILRQDASLWAGTLKGLKVAALTDLQIFCYTKKGAKIPVSLSGSSLKNEEGEVIGFMIVFKDLRELRKYAKKRVDEITPLLQSISLGDFTKKPELPSSEDEFTDLLVAIDLMAENLRGLIEESQKKTDEIKFSKNKLEIAHHGLKKALTTIEKEKAKSDTLLASLGEAVTAIDLRGNVIILNHEAEELFGHLSREVLGRPYAQLVELKNEKGAVISFTEYPLKEALAHKKVVFTTTFLTRKGAEPLPLATTVSPILFGEKLLGVVATFRDITKEMEIDRAKTEFVSLASHQLRTPLTAIKWLLQELLRKGGLTKTQHEYAQDALKSNDRMVSLVNDLLNVSRLETGKISVLSKRADITDILGQIINEVNAELRDKNIKINFIRPASSVSIEVDVQLFQQVVSNLLSNAVKYSDPGTAVTLRLAKKARKVQIEVEDHGIGIPKDQQHRIFEKFFRTGEAVKRSTTGSGLGLYIVKKIMHACHGSIRFISRENKGTKFILIFPEKGPVLKEGERQLIPHRIS